MFAPITEGKPDFCTLGCYLHLRHKANRQPGAVWVAAAQNKEHLLDGVLHPAGAQIGFASYLRWNETAIAAVCSVRVYVVNMGAEPAG